MFSIAHIDENKDALKKYEELLKKIKNITRSISNSLDHYNEK